MRRLSYLVEAQFHLKIMEAYQQSERVTEIVGALRGLINPAYFNNWLMRPNKFFGKSPYQAIIDGDYEKLQEFILTTREGVFA